VEKLHHYQYLESESFLEYYLAIRARFNDNPDPMLRIKADETIRYQMPKLGLVSKDGMLTELGLIATTLHLEPKEVMFMLVAFKTGMVQEVLGLLLAARDEKLLRIACRGDCDDLKTVVNMVAMAMRDPDNAPPHLRGVVVEMLKLRVKMEKAAWTGDMPQQGLDAWMSAVMRLDPLTIARKRPPDNEERGLQMTGWQLGGLVIDLDQKRTYTYECFFVLKYLNLDNRRKALLVQAVGEEPPIVMTEHEEMHYGLRVPAIDGFFARVNLDRIYPDQNDKPFAFERFF
jgi:hypothetical protein